MPRSFHTVTSLHTGFHREIAAADLGPSWPTGPSGPSQSGLFRESPSWPALLQEWKQWNYFWWNYFNSITDTDKTKRLQQTVPHLEVHEGHLITTDCASRGSAWGTSHYNRLCLTWKCMRDISVFPFSACWFLGGANNVPWPLAFTQFQPLEWNIATTVTMEHHPNYTQCFHPLEQSITTTITMEHHPYYTQNFQLLEWNITTV